MTGDPTFWLRVYVIAVSVVCAVAGSLQWRRWPRFKPENQLAWLALAALNLAIGIGTLESLHAHLPGGYRNYLTALAMTWLLAAVLYVPVTERWARRRSTKEKS